MLLHQAHRLAVRAATPCGVLHGVAARMAPVFLDVSLSLGFRVSDETPLFHPLTACRRET